MHNGELPLPAVVLVVSGGHTSLYLVPYGRACTSCSAGPAMTRPGRPTTRSRGCSVWAIRAARSSTASRQHGNDRAVDLPVTRITHRDRNAPDAPGTQRLQLQRAEDRGAAPRRAAQGARRRGRCLSAEIADLCASFQRVVVESLLDRLFEAARTHGAASVGIAGGVSANSRLRADALARGAREGLPVFIPSLALSTDNAAMIAAAGLRRYAAGVRAGADLNADASLALT